jgi:hypothetical protein
VPNSNVAESARVTVPYPCSTPDAARCRERPAELLKCVRRNGVHAPELICWLVDEGFAVRVQGGLAPTEKTRELAGAIA